MKHLNIKVYRFSLDCFLVSWYLENTLQSTALHHLQEFAQPLSIRIPGHKVLKFVRSRETNTKLKYGDQGYLSANAQSKTVLWALSCLNKMVAQTVLSYHQVWYPEEMRVEMIWIRHHTSVEGGSEVVESSELRLVLQQIMIKALLRIFWNQVVHPEGDLLRIVF